MKSLFLLAVSCLILALSVPVAATGYPDKTVQFIVPFGPGGSTDVETRLLLKTFNKNFPREAVVINIAGAGGAVGARKVHDAKPDGYNLLSFNTILPVLRIMGMIDFNYTDLAPVALFSTSDTGVFVRNDSSWQSVKDMVADAKKRPGKIHFGVGFGTLAHLGTIALEQKADIKLNIVDTGGGEKNPPPCTRIPPIRPGHKEVRHAPFRRQSDHDVHGTAFPRPLQRGGGPRLPMGGVSFPL